MNSSPPRGRITLAAWPSPTCTWCVCGEPKHLAVLSHICIDTHIPCLVCSPASVLSIEWIWHLFVLLPRLVGEVCPPVPNTSSKLGRARTLEQNAGGLKASASGSFHSTTSASPCFTYHSVCRINVYASKRRKGNLHLGSASQKLLFASRRTSK